LSSRLVHDITTRVIKAKRKYLLKDFILALILVEL
jgi:hypothetical protein